MRPNLILPCICITFVGMISWLFADEIKFKEVGVVLTVVEKPNDFLEIGIFDWNNDLKKDLLLGTVADYPYNVYQNTGSNSDPKFENCYSFYIPFG